ncbi:MAG: ABC transporter ATP-binding protein [Thermoplasmataceae archaeon]
MSTIELRNVHKRMGKYNTLKIGELSVRSPIILGLLGPNGAGKSTLLKLISGCVSSFEGIIEINGIDIKERRESAIKDMGSLIENPNFYQFVSGYQLLRFIGQIRKGSNGIDEEIHQTLKKLGLSKKGQNQIRTYSTGETKRLSLGAAIIGEPKIILLDEPSDNLDIFGELVFEDLIRDISIGEQKIIIIASHDIEMLEKLCDEVIIIIDGNIEGIVKIDGDENRKIITLDKNIDVNSDLNQKYEIRENTIRIEIKEEKELINVIQESFNLGYKIVNVKNESSLEKKYLEILKIKGMSILQSID